jgi:hypothetical protein
MTSEGQSLFLPRETGTGTARSRSLKTFLTAWSEAYHKQDATFVAQVGFPPIPQSSSDLDAALWRPPDPSVGMLAHARALGSFHSCRAYAQQRFCPHTNDYAPDPQP